MRWTRRPASASKGISSPGCDLEAVRHAELNAIRRWFSPGLRVLEIGGGSGFQASLITAMGCDVLSVDLPTRGVNLHSRFHPVHDYDGAVLPAADGSVDRVFSSNVLEHVTDLPGMLAEIHRVLRPEGLAIHVLPSATWRMWTSIAFFGHVLRSALGRAAPEGARTGSFGERLDRAGRWRAIARLAVSPLRAHGSYPNALCELYTFTRRRWRGLFIRHGFRLCAVEPSRIFHTGYILFPSVSIRTRTNLSRLLGSAGHIFVMTPCRDSSEG